MGQTRWSRHVSSALLTNSNATSGYASKREGRRGLPGAVAHYNEEVTWTAKWGVRNTVLPPQGGEGIGMRLN
ncbi:hypothetical protein E2C01_065988 [Portunus trituberculatus]|uniref:Uncharacterized protein n=1 Tax=Portunus trituberculatus TaxID=210409 RepID=A0A5B7HNL2_PORTR|nr:hypothetical protein [Portunus trituberculatus]